MFSTYKLSLLVENIIIKSVLGLYQRSESIKLDLGVFSFSTYLENDREAIESIGKHVMKNLPSFYESDKLFIVRQEIYNKLYPIYPDSFIMYIYKCIMYDIYMQKLKVELVDENIIFQYVHKH